MSKAQYYCASSVDAYIAEADDTIEGPLKHEGGIGGDEVEQIWVPTTATNARPKVEMLSCCAA